MPRRDLRGRAMEKVYLFIISLRCAALAAALGRQGAIRRWGTPPQKRRAYHLRRCFCPIFQALMLIELLRGLFTILSYFAMPMPLVYNFRYDTSTPAIYAQTSARCRQPPTRVAEIIAARKPSKFDAFDFSRCGDAAAALIAGRFSEI